MFAYILVLFSMGSALLWAGRTDIASGNSRDGRLMIMMGLCSLAGGGALFFASPGPLFPL